MRLDHVSYVAGPEGLAATAQRLGSQLGAGFTDGGLHPRFGTRNFVLPLAGGCYVEVVAPLDHPALEKSPFGQAVKGRAEAGGGWLGWVVSVPDIRPVEQRLGRPAVDGNRHRPDGVELRWKQLGVKGTMADPQLPFFVQWQVPAADHPGAPGGRVRLARLELSGDPGIVASWLGEPEGGPLEDVEVEWVDAEATGLLAVHFTTPHGPVRVD